METRYKRSKRRWLLLTIFPRDAVQEVRLKKRSADHASVSFFDWAGLWPDNEDEVHVFPNPWPIQHFLHQHISTS